MLIHQNSNGNLEGSVLEPSIFIKFILLHLPHDIVAENTNIFVDDTYFVLKVDCWRTSYSL